MADARDRVVVHLDDGKGVLGPAGSNGAAPLESKRGDRDTF
jgi:hypothetical protein